MCVCVCVWVGWVGGSRGQGMTSGRGVCTGSVDCSKIDCVARYNVALRVQCGMVRCAGWWGLVQVRRKHKFNPVEYTTYRFRSERGVKMVRRSGIQAQATYCNSVRPI